MSKIKAAEAIRPAMDARLRTNGMTPTPIPKPEPDARIADPKKRAKLHAKAVRNAEHANAALIARARASVNAPWWGCPAGRAVATALPEIKRATTDMDIPTLWDAIQRVRAVYAKYWQAIGAPQPSPAGMNLELLPDEFGSDGVEISGGWDGRSEEERVKAATAAMMHMEMVLGMAGQGVLAEVKAVVLRDDKCRRVDRLIVGLAAVARDG